MKATKHFHIRTGYSEMTNLYKLYAQIAERWADKEIEHVRIFRAGMVDAYVSIRAGRWYHCSCSDDPDWLGDAEDLIADGVYGRHYRALAGAPHPEKTWQGNWRDFGCADDLRKYADEKLARLTGANHDKAE